MDEDCRNCPALCDPRSRVVHGYGDVGADFLFVGERPSAAADTTGLPFDSDDDPGLWAILDRLEFCPGPPGPDASAREDPPTVDNAFLTLLTRCRDPERPPTDREVSNCEPYLNAEIRSINPEVLVPVGERALREIAAEYTTRDAEGIDLRDAHATTIRGRGFEILPAIDPREATDDQYESFVAAMSEIMGRDYRQTKGRRGR